MFIWPLDLFTQGLTLGLLITPGRLPESQDFVVTGQPEARTSAILAGNVIFQIGTPFPVVLRPFVFIYLFSWIQICSRSFLCDIYRWQGGASPPTARPDPGVAFSCVADHLWGSDLFLYRKNSQPGTLEVVESTGIILYAFWEHTFFWEESLLPLDSRAGLLTKGSEEPWCSIPVR